MSVKAALEARQKMTGSVYMGGVKIVTDTTLTQPGKPADAKAVGDSLAGLDKKIPTVPAALPNPNKLKFTGAVNAEYDGKTEVEVLIPRGSENAVLCTQQTLSEAQKAQARANIGAAAVGEGGGGGGGATAEQIAQIEKNKNDITQMSEQLSKVNTAAQEMQAEVFESSVEATEEIPLNFSNVGWYMENGTFRNTDDGRYAEVPVVSGERYRLKGSANWYMTPFIILDSTGGKLYSAPSSGSASYLVVEEDVTIPAGGVKICFTVETTNVHQQAGFQCIKYVTGKGGSRITKLENSLAELNDFVKDDSLYVKSVNPVLMQIGDFSNFGFYTSNLKLNATEGYKHSKTPVTPGLTYSVKYYSQYTTTMVVTDADGKAILAGKVSDSSSYVWFEDEIVIPESGAFICLSSGDTTWDDNRNAECQIIEYAETFVPVGQFALDEMRKANILYGKKWVACGDSFTHGSLVDPDESPFFEEGIYLGKRKTYPYFIGLRNGMTIVNEAISGSTMALDKDYVDGVAGVAITENNPFSYERYQAIDADADYITLWFGINDGNHCRLGTIDDTTNETFYGAWNVVLEWLIENRPNAKIGIIVTNLSYEGFRQAIRDVAHKWGIPYLDMNGDYQTPPIVDGRESNMGMCERAKELRANHFRISADNSHPTVNAHRYESTFIEAFLRRL